MPLAGQSETVYAREGASLGGMVAVAFPDPIARRFVVAFIDGEEIPVAAWDALKPRTGAIINLCFRPGDGDSDIGKALRTVLQIAVIAAAAWVGAMVGGLPGILAQAGVAMVGNLLINTLIPVSQIKAQGEAPTPFYTVTGARNASRLWSPVSFVLGKHRFFPPLYGQYIQETVGNDVYLRVPFCLGPGPVSISDLKIGDTPLSSYTGVEVETRLKESDPAHTLYAGDPVQDAVGAQLSTTFTSRNTALDVDEIEVVLGFRAGLGGYDSKGKKQSRSVTIEVKYRPAGSSDAFQTYRPTVPQANSAAVATGASGRTSYFGSAPNLLSYVAQLGALGGVANGPNTITRADPGRAFQEVMRFAVPRHAAGYEVQVRRTTADASDNSDLVWWEILGSRKSYVDPFPERKLASLVLRIKASAQLNGVIDTFNCIVEPEIPKFSTAAKTTPSTATAASLTTTGVSRNPAEMVLNLYRGPQAANPRPDDRIDWPAWAAFAAFCETKGLRYDEVIEGAIARGELARRICSSAFGRPIRWGGKLSVVIDRDRSSEAPAQTFTPRNVSNLRWRKSFPAETHAVRIAFANAANGYQADETILYLDGYSAANATKYETLPVSGKTDADEVRIVGRQFINNALRQTETFEFDMDAEALTCRPGAYTQLLHDAIGVGLGSARVLSKQTSGGNVTAFTLDTEIPTDVGDSLAARWRKEDGSGGFAVATERAITRDPANAKRFVITVPLAIASAPDIDEMVLVGKLTEVSLPVLVRDVSWDFGQRANVVCIPYAGERFTPDGTPLPPHDPKVTLPIAARPATPVLISTAANAREMSLAFTQPASPRGVTLTGFETAIRENGNASDSWQDRGALPADARVFVAPPGNPGYFYDLRVVAVGEDAEGLPVRSDPLIVSNVASAVGPVAPAGCSASFATRTSTAGASQLVLTANWTSVDDPDVLDTRVEMRVSTGPDVWAEIGQARAILGKVEIHGLQVGRSYTLGFVHLSRRGIASNRTTISAITAPDTLVATGAMTAVSGSPLDAAIGSMATAAAAAAAADAAKIAAQLAEANATTQASNASGSAASAAGSASTATTQAGNAGVSAAAASASQVSAALARDGANLTASQQLPTNFEQDSIFWTDTETGSAATNTDVLGGTFPTVAGIGKVYRQVGAGNDTVMPRGVLTAVPGRTYEAEVVARVTVDSTLTGGTKETANLLSWRALDASYAGALGYVTPVAVAGFIGTKSVFRAADGWTTFKVRYTVPGSPSFAYLRPRFYNGYDAGGNGNATMEVRSFRITDVSAVVESEAQASASAVSAAAAGVAQTAAGVSATAAQTSAVTAQAAVNKLIPSRVENAADWTGITANGDPSSAAANALGGSVVNVANKGNVRRITTNVGGATRGWLPVIAGNTYRMTIDMQCTVAGASGNRSRMNFRYYDATGAYLAAAAATIISTVTTFGWTRTVAEISGATILAAQATAAYVRGSWFVNENGTFATVELASLELTDVTSEVAAAASAVAAAASQATATADAAVSTASAGVSASYAGAAGVVGLLPNSKFMTGVTGGIPKGWANSNAATGGSQQARPGISGAYIYRLAGGAAADNRIKADTLGAQVGSIVAGRRYLLRASAIIGAGTNNGAGVLVDWINAAGTVISTSRVHFANDPTTNGAVANNHVGLTSWEIPLTAPALAVRAVVHACSHDSTLYGGNSVANSIDWYECDLVAESYSSALAQTNSGAIAGINAAAAFIESVVAAGGGDLGAFRLRAGAGGSFIELISTVLRLANVTNGSVVEIMRAIAGEAFFSRPISADGGGKRVTIGPGYGVSGQEVVLWFGPDTIAPSSQSRTNGYWSFGTDGNPYLGSSSLNSTLPFKATRSGTQAGVRTGAGSVSSGTITVTPANGGGAYTHNWRFVSGDASITISSSTSNAVTFSTTVAVGIVKEAIWEDVVTDDATGLSVVVRAFPRLRESTAS